MQKANHFIILNYLYSVWVESKCCAHCEKKACTESQIVHWIYTATINCTMHSRAVQSAYNIPFESISLLFFVFFSCCCCKSVYEFNNPVCVWVTCVTWLDSLFLSSQHTTIACHSYIYVYNISFSSAFILSLLSIQLLVAFCRHVACITYIITISNDPIGSDTSSIKREI